MGFSSARENSHGPAGARLERAVDAAHLLCDLVWEDLREQVRRRGGASTPRSAQLAERIGDLASTVALLASADAGTTPSATPARDGTRAAAAGAPASDARPAAVLIDEHDEQTDASRASSACLARDRLADDGRGGRPAWLGLIESALARFERDQIAFALLLVEVLDVGEPAAAHEHIERAAARALEAIDPASIEPEGRHLYWLLVPRADRLGAHVVAERLARAFGGVDDGIDAADRYFAALSARGSRPRQGRAAAPLALVVGTAACPENGCDVSALVAQAHIGLAAARSARARSVAATERVYR
jgi:hypothetical protein